jgi:sucrose-6-phosphate hydrolase SacC (GH32 family)
MPLSWHAARLALHVFIDRSVVEVFAGEGQATLSALLEPDAVCQGVDVFAQSGLARLAHADVWALAPVWE